MHRNHPRRTAIVGPSFQLLSNWCSLGCAGCGIKVSPPAGADIVMLEQAHLKNVRNTLGAIKQELENRGLQYAMVEQSGGEPTHHPQVVETLGEVFEDSVHKIITNGLTSKSIYPYLKQRGDRALLVLSIDHHLVEFNQIRLGMIQKSQPARAAEIHGTILDNLDVFCRNDIPVVVSSIISAC